MIITSPIKLKMTAMPNKSFEINRFQAPIRNSRELQISKFNFDADAFPTLVHFEIYKSISLVNKELIRNIDINEASVSANTTLLSLSSHDLAVMVGLGSFFGAAGSIGWSFFTGSGAPQVFTISIAAAGFITGKILSHREARGSHD